MTNALSSLSTTQLRRALELREQIDLLQNELDEIQGTPSEAPARGPGKRRGRPPGPGRGRVGRPPGSGRRKFSAEARAKMGASQRARRAKEQGESAPWEEPAAKPKRKNRALSLAAKARWAKIKAAGKNRL